ncbi:endophilin-B2-like [Oncorhynchus clarkii lewisi]|uniref:endophilin-B2-like n=1 Tax=Oncorhynchus clarkii lewisi TaxID=490388 RepID=UPI0039B98CC3
MDITRLAVDAGAFINRAVQYTEEALGQAEKTELDSRLESLLDRAESTKTWTDKIISQTETLLQPNPGARLEDLLYKGLDWSAPERPTPHELLSENMMDAALELGRHTPYGSTLIKCGELERQIGLANKKLIQSTDINFLSPLRRFTDQEYTVIQNERRQLVNKRLDLDIAKARLRKAQEADIEARGLNANPLGEEYVAHVSYMFSFLRVRWLKMWAQEVSQAEMELRISQCVFDRQSEITRLLLEGINTTHAAHSRSLSDFVEAQGSYYAQCYQLTQDLHTQLACAPPLICYNNNWHLETNQPSTGNLPLATIQPLATSDSATTNQATSQPLTTTQPLATCESSTTIQATSQPLSTNQANSQPLATNQTANESSKTNKSSTTNKSLTNNQTSRQLLATTGSSTTNQALPIIQTNSQALQTNQATSQALQTNQATSQPLQTNQATSQPLQTNQAIRQPLQTNQATSQPLQTNQATSQPLQTNQATSQPLQTNQATSQPLGTNQATSQPLQTNQAIRQPLQTNPATSQPLGTNQATSQPRQTNQATSQPLQTNQATSQPLGTNQATSQPVGTNQATSQPLQTNQATRQPLQTNPATSQPLGTNQATSQSLQTIQATNESPTTNVFSTTNESLITNQVTNQPSTSNQVTNQSLATYRTNS